jgi:pSer/pThr/pTyr-binding forkhead associated (FHA) protein
MGKLVHLLANGTAREIRLDRERITLGRRPDNDVCLPQAPVSGAHAAVVTILADSFLEDLGSTNGTLVNGKAIKKHFLRDRDEIDIGKEILVYLADDAAKLETPPRGLDRLRDAAAGTGGNAAAPSTATVPGVPDAIPRGKRRSDGQAAPARPVDAATRPASAELEAGAVGSSAPEPGLSADAGEEPSPDRQAELAPAIRVLSGASAGRILPLAKSETLVGRAGVQVAALQRTGNEVRVVPVEGASPPSVNGTPIAAEGQRLAAGDTLEVAGARLDIIIPEDARP